MTIESGGFAAVPKGPDSDSRPKGPTEPSRRLRLPGRCLGFSQANHPAPCKGARSVLAQCRRTWGSTLAPFQGTGTRRPESQDIGLRPQPCAGLYRPVGPKTPLTAEFARTSTGADRVLNQAFGCRSILSLPLGEGRGEGVPTYIAILFLALCFIFGAATPAHGGELVLSGPRVAQDTMLRNGVFWGKWNYGKALYLQVGAQPSTVYDTYRSVGLLRFDLSNVRCDSLTSAALRLYFPRNQIQQEPAGVSVYAVSDANAGWREGNVEAEAQADACSWEERAQGSPWAGGPGLCRPGIDYLTNVLASANVDGLNGQWVEFKLPTALVQSWANHPEKNAGLLLKTDDGTPVGQSAYICSSQHWSGNGPRLVLRGNVSEGAAGVSTSEGQSYNPRYELPPMGPAYERWRQESTTRYAAWARDPALHLTGTQAVMPYVWDIVLRGNVILPKVTLPMSELTDQIPEAAAHHDSGQARQIMEAFMARLMAFDYVRDQNWYDSGPNVDVLSPLQIARLFVKDDLEGEDEGAKGIYSQYDDGRWRDALPDPAAQEKELQAQLAKIKERLHPTAAEYARIEACVAENFPQEKLHARALKESLDRVRNLERRNVDGTEMLLALRAMFFHHRMFLIHQSFFSMPKYQVLLRNGDAVGYAQWFYEVRHRQYSRARADRQLAAATRYMWRAEN